MTVTPRRALLLLDAQRYHHEDLEATDVLAMEKRLLPWRQAIQQARKDGDLVVYFQRDGEVGSVNEPLTRGWTLHPDFRVEEGELLLRVQHDDAFAGSLLVVELRTRGIEVLELLALPDSLAARATAQGAQAAGFTVNVIDQTPEGQ